MAAHDNLLQKLTDMLSCQKLLQTDLPPDILAIFKSRSLDLEQPKKRKFLINNLVHAADIGNPVLPYDRYINWSYLVCQEFQQQYEKEVKYGLPVTQMFRYINEETFLKGQILFIGTFVLPVWKQLGQVCSGLRLEERIEENLAELQNRL